jgi:hypothetical protein
MFRLGSRERLSMNEKATGHRGPRAVALAAATAAVAVLAAACGGGSASSPAGPASGGPGTFAQEVALAQCMRSHGAPDFPDPSASGGFTLHETISAQMLAAYGDCRHLLPGGPSLAQVQQEAQQQQQKLQQLVPGLLKFAICVRSHGVPGFPDPTANGQFTPGALKAAGVTPQSTQFQAALRDCQHVLPGGVEFHASAQEHAS